ncbi:NAD binding domain of 6-phosphogluconate dehydrogenase [Gaiella occulta]|uniref:NAD binding domain of 6-phosphogluconate dehydrogenase n=1 Tax=Gaiella occulta TaxID=1002870 RepID=A0A7M2YX00_9ACTN|nr:NAD binding domain of 6-phosphogluconate dehydrogenase [Gaiella occulta]
MDAGAVARLEREGATGSTSYADIVARLDGPRAVWVMVPAALVGGIIADLAPLPGGGDIVIDGGNSDYRDGIERAANLTPQGIDDIDAGTFLRAFRCKGRLAPVLDEIPVRVILDGRAALLGAALAASSGGPR